MQRFSNATTTARIDAIVDAGSFESQDQSDAAIIAGAARVGGVPVWIVASDPTRARGAIGSREADALCVLFGAARRAPRPVLLLLDSSGAKVDEGVVGLGLFRRLFREALLTRAAGVPMLAVLGRSCFGGASLLGCLCNARLYSSATLLAVSGPAVIQALSGETELKAADRKQVVALMGGEARGRLGSNELLLTDSLDAFHRATTEWVCRRSPQALETDTATEHERLGQRLEASAWQCGGTLTDRAQLELHRLVPPGYSYSSRGCVSIAEPLDASRDSVFLGVLTGSTVDAAACWILADELLRVRRSQSDRPVTLVLDASGHAATYRDEALMLSAYLVHLSVVIAEMVASGQDVELRVSGAAAGAVYVAFAAAADRVLAYPSARIRILPDAAVRSIVGTHPGEEITPDALVASGVVDAVVGEAAQSAASVVNLERQ